MAEALREVSFPSQRPVKVSKLKVHKGRHVSKGDVLALYIEQDAKEGAESSGSKPTQQKLKSNGIGTVIDVYVKEGEVIQPGCHVLTIGPCKHPTVMKDMCAECGVDLRFEFGKSGDRKEPVSASVAMVHSIPELIVSEEQAFELGQEDQDRLLKTRKLVLLVDLDQTLIHTTNDDIPVNLKGVHHFQQWHGNAWLWYHTKLRPSTEEFLERISEYYELHICTFGVRMYAHTITKIIDPKGKYFSHRILSRDECFNAQSKVANLKALFPCGDSMVCIIDDREDVWKYSSNLIHVKPYHFFQGTADINAPPGLTKTENDAKPVIHRVRKISHSKSRDSISEKSDSSTTSDKVLSESDLAETEQLKSDATNVLEQNRDTGTGSACDKNSKDERLDSKQNVKETGGDDDRQKTSTAGGTGEVLAKEEENNNVNTESNTLDTSTEDAKSTGDKVEKKDLPSGCSEASVFEEKNVISETISGTSDGGEENKDEKMETIKLEVKDIQVTEDKDVNMTDVNDTKETSVCETTNEVKNNGSLGNPTDLSVKDNTQEEVKLEEKSSSEDKQKVKDETDAAGDSDVEEEIIWEDEDDYLLYLPEILIKIHKAFYDFYDQMKDREQKQLPDLKHIIPYVRKKVLRGVSLVFSGVIPRNMLPESSRAYKVAKALGANIQNEIVLKSNGNNTATTHLVAARLGTAKVNMGKKHKKLKVVTPQWLWVCNDRWERVDERLFPLNDDTSVSSGTNSPVPDAGKLKGTSQQNGKKRKSDELESEGDLFDPKTDNSSVSDSAIESMVVSSDSASEDSSVVEATCFAETVNPLMSFTNAELLKMDKEVEELMDDDDDDDNESGSSENERREAQLRNKVLSPRYEIDESSVDSIDGAYPRGWRKRRRIEEIEKDSEESEVGEEYNEIEHTNDLLLNIKHDLEVSTSSDSDDKESIGSVDDELAEAVEREFLS